MDKQYLNECAKVIESKLPDNYQFILMAAPANTPDARLVYISSMSRESAIKVLKEFLFKSGESADWMKHIN